MLKRTFILALTSVLIFWGLLLANLLIVRPSDYKDYQTLLDQKTGKMEKNALLQPVRQMRSDVQKDVWFCEGKDRLHFRIHSECSELALKMADNKPEIVETLQNLECDLQDKLYFDHAGKKFQQLRHFTANEGVYLFPSHRFFAEKVNLSFCQALGHELPFFLNPEQSFLTGYATEVSFFLSDKNPAFTASHLKAKVRPERGDL